MAAPVADACGLAGGTPWGGDAPEEGRYKNTTFASHGMRGTLLPPIPGYVPPVWTAGLVILSRTCCRQFSL